MAVEVATRSGAIEVGTTRSLFNASDETGGFDVSADGQRFLLLTSPEQSLSEPLTLIQNWTAVLKK